jgi:hypothetical protein
MQVARRVYLYIISFISLMMLLNGAAALLRLFGDYLFRFLVIRAGLYDPLL